MTQCIKETEQRAKSKVECRQRILWIDTLKGLAIVLVLLGHIYRNDTIYNWIYSFHMPVFFFAAGYVYKQRPIIMDIKRRARTILIPYFIFGAINLLYWVLIERRFREQNLTFFGALIGLIRGQQSFLDFNVHLWFLPCFFFLTIIFNILINCIGNKWTNIIVILISLLFSLFGNILPELPWGIDRIGKYLFFYAAGVALNKYSYCRQFDQKWILLGIILLVLEAISVDYLGRTGIVWFLNATLGIAGLMLISLAARHMRILELLGRSTLVILCFHGPIYRVIIQALSYAVKWNTEAIRANIGFVLIVIVATLLLCQMIYQIIVRYTPWMLGKQVQTNR